MDYIDLITNIGFPIAACIYLAKSNKDIQNYYNEQLNELKKSLFENTLELKNIASQIVYLIEDLNIKEDENENI